MLYIRNFRFLGKYKNKLLLHKNVLFKRILHGSQKKGSEDPEFNDKIKPSKHWALAIVGPENGVVFYKNTSLKVIKNSRYPPLVLPICLHCGDKLRHSECDVMFKMTKNVSHFKIGKTYNMADLNLTDGSAKVPNETRILGLIPRIFKNAEIQLKTCCTFDQTTIRKNFGSIAINISDGPESADIQLAKTAPNKIAKGKEKKLLAKVSNEQFLYGTYRKL